MTTQTIPLATEKDRERLLAFVQAVGLDKPLECTIEARQSSRSKQQNRLYWKWIGIISTNTGSDKDALHQLFMQRFLTPSVSEIAGEIITTYSSKRLKVAEMHQYMTQVNALAGEFGVYLPHPEDAQERK